MTINITNLPSLTNDEFKETVETLAGALRDGRRVQHKVIRESEREEGTPDQQAQSQALQILEGGAAQAEPPGPDVLEDLRAVLLAAHEKGMAKALRNELAVIRQAADKIRFAHPDPASTFEEIPADVADRIKVHMHPGEYRRVVPHIPENWRRLSRVAQIAVINIQRLPMREALPGRTAMQMVDWIIQNRAHAQLQYADFSGVRDFDNACLEKLTKNCPNLQHILLRSTTISGEALKHLAHIPQLQSLNIGSCSQLEADSLKHLEHTKQLQSLNIAHCGQLAADALKHLAHTPQLLSLNIGSCSQLAADSLKHLAHTPQLLSLDIAWCRQLAADALKHLEHTPQLQSLNIGGCSQLEPDALKHLEHTKQLLSLDINGCSRLEADALKHLAHTPQLQSLKIHMCFRLEADALKHLAHTPQLQSLNIHMSDQLERDALPERMRHLLNP